MSSIKIIRASQAPQIYLYKNLKSKYLKCCARNIPKYQLYLKYVLNVVSDDCFIYNIIVIINTKKWNVITK